MKKSRGLFFAVVGSLFLILVSSSFVFAGILSLLDTESYSAALSILSLPVRNAIKASQGHIFVRIPVFGKDEFIGANGVLVIDNIHVLTMAHVATKYPAVATSADFMFNNVPMKLVSIDPEKDIDLAIFELDHPIPGMKPAELANLKKFGEIYTGISFYTDFAVAFKLILSGVRRGMFIFNKPSQLGESGSPIWDDQGKLVSIISSTSNAVTFATRFESINEFLEKTRESIEKDKNKIKNPLELHSNPNLK